MLTSTTTLCLLVLSGYLVYKYFIFPSLTSSLSRLPNSHLACSLTSQWFERARVRKGEQKTLHALHQKHGPILRLGPAEVSVVSEQGLKEVYVAGFDKGIGVQQTFKNYGAQNLVSTLDHETHAQYRRMITSLYTKSYIQHSHNLELISRRIVLDEVMPLLEERARGAQEVDVMKLFERVAVDLITAYLFGPSSGTHFLVDTAGRDAYFEEWQRLRDNPTIHELPITEALYMRMCEATLSESKSSSAELDSDPPVLVKMYHELSTRASEWRMSENEVLVRCASEMVDHIAATQASNAIVWTYIVYQLSLRPSLQEELRAEIRANLPSLGQDAEAIAMAPAEIDRLPLLDAIVRETLRLHAPNPARLHRVIPAQGLELHGFWLPPGTSISTNAYCLHRDEDAFPNPLLWSPRRWMNESEQGVNGESKRKWDAMRKLFFAFGSGPRMCIGQHFAVQVIKLVVASIYARFETSIMDDTGIEQSDSFNSGPIGHKLVIKFCQKDV